MSTPETRAVLYYREEDNTSLPELRDHCRKYHFILTDETTGWEDAIDLAKKRLVDVVVVPSFSALPMTNDKFPTLDLMIVEKDLRERGASFFVISERIGTSTAEGLLMFTCMAAMNGYRRRVGSDD